MSLTKFNGPCLADDESSLGGTRLAAKVTPGCGTEAINRPAALGTGGVVGKSGNGAGTATASEPFAKYLAALRTSDLKEKTEHTDRDALKALVQNLAPESVTVVHEAKGVKGTGTPDFKVRQNGQIIGYVETKPIGTGLDELKRLLKSDQIKRYRTLSPNLVLTDYLNWIWERDGIIESATLCNKDEVWSSKPLLNPDRVNLVSRLVNGFTAVPPQRISRANILAHELATRSRLLREFIRESLVNQSANPKKAGKLYGLYSAFQTLVSETITLSEFADAFSQTLCYGLFLAKLNANGTSLNLENAKHHIPSSFKLIQELVGFLEELNTDEYNSARWVVDGIASLINGLDIKAIKNDLSFQNRKGSYRKLKAKDEEEWRLFSRDPFIYFYEDYLAEYDKEIKERRGVYYTPPPVVKFIIRATNDLLRHTFNLPLGLADHSKVTVLDFACGTGTFIVEIIEQIMEHAGASSAKREMLIKEHVLKNVFAFEYLIAPYTVAHLKLSQYLQDRQIRLDTERHRFNIFLTNTLEPLEPQHNFFVPALSEETRNAAAVKHQRLLVIAGNPPYSGHSLNKGSWISDEVRKYRKGVPELSKPAQGKWLQDDYVKFLRFAQCKMDDAPEGIVAVITNNAYLDNPTFRGMRKSLMETFNQIYLLDLHGSTKKKETTPTGGHDENVFDIQQGVSIAFFVKKPGAEEGVWRSDLWGDRLSKYQTLSEASHSSIAWKKIVPIEPLYLFRELDNVAAAAYDDLWSITDIFAPTGRPAPGIVTTHDDFAISFTKDEAIEKVETLLATKNETEARELFTLCSQSQWSYGVAKKELKKTDYRKLLIPVLYRPFDKRWTIWDSNVAVHRRERIMKHMLRDNVAVAVSRQFGAIGEKEFDAVMATSEVVDFNCFRRGGEYIFPAYFYKNTDGLFAKARNGAERVENISEEFRKWLSATYSHRHSAEDILHYVFAVLHAKSYRKRYLDFLRSDFPRIPFPLDESDLKTLSSLGKKLMQAHLLRTVPDYGLGSYTGTGSNVVERVRYSSNEQAIYVNDDQYFANIPVGVWGYHIGGYNVLEKYLKDRRKRKLALADVNTIAGVANVLAFTLEQTQAIEAAYVGARFK